MGLNGGAPAAEFEFSGDINVLDQGFELDPVGSISSNMMSNINPSLTSNKFAIDKLQIPPNPMLSNNLTPTSQFQPPLETTTVLINRHQAQPTQNPSFLLPFPYPQTEPHLVLPPPAKRHNPSIHQQQPHLGPHNLGISHHQPHLGPHNLLGMRPKTAGDEVGHHQNHHRDAVFDQLYKVAEQVQAGNSRRRYWRGSITTSLQSVGLFTGLLSSVKRLCNCSSVQTPRTVIASRLI